MAPWCHDCASASLAVWRGMAQGRQPHLALHIASRTAFPVACGRPVAPAITILVEALAVEVEAGGHRDSARQAREALAALEEGLLQPFGDIFSLGEDDVEAVRTPARLADVLSSPPSTDEAAKDPGPSQH